MKSPGLYFVAGALLFFVYREQALSTQGQIPPHRAKAYPAFVLLCLAVFLGLLAKLILQSVEVSDFFHFVLPPSMIVALLVARERYTTQTRSSPRFKVLFAMVMPFLFSVALPIALFSAFYWFHHAFHQLLNGLFVLHLQRLVSARLDPPSPVSSLPSIILALLLTEDESRGRFRRPVAALKILVGALLLACCFRFRLIYLVVLQVPWGAIPVLSVAAVAFLWRRSTGPTSPSPLNQQVELLLSVTVLFSLIQFPFSIPIYFCYVAPLTILTVAVVLSGLPHLPRWNACAASVFLGLFAVLVLRPGFLTYMRYGYHADEQTVPLTLQRANGLRVSQEHAAEYQQLIPFVQKLAAGRAVLAAPECPEVYFLAGLHNPTGILFDFFHPPQEYQTQIQALLDRPDFIKVVVLLDTPEFSSEQKKVLQANVPPRFPNSRTIGNFEVYWRP